LAKVKFSSCLYPQYNSKQVLFDLVAPLFLCPHQELRLCSSLPINRSHRCLEARLNLSPLVSTCAPRFLVVSLLRTPPSTQFSSTCPTLRRSMAITLWPSNAVLIIFFTSSAHLALIFSTDTFQLDYPPQHTELFLDQVHANVIGGFTANTNSPDPNFGKCMQCVAIDRARYKLKPPLERSSICTQCFQQYCFDPNNVTSVSELPGRKLDFVDPDPQGISAVSGFLSQNKVAFILSFLALLIIVAGLSAFLCVLFPLPRVSELIPTSYFLCLVEYGENVGHVGLSTTR